MITVGQEEDDSGPLPPWAIESNSNVGPHNSKVHRILAIGVIGGGEAVHAFIDCNLSLWYIALRVPIVFDIFRLEAWRLCT